LPPIRSRARTAGRTTRGSLALSRLGNDFQLLLQA